jgi:hypothetical protein
LKDLEAQVLLARIDENVDALLARGSDDEARLRKVEPLISVAMAYVGRKLGL